MKKLLYLVVLIVVFAALAVSCRNTPQGQTPTSQPTVIITNISDILRREWKLIQVHSGDRIIEFNRIELISAGAGDIFTLVIDSETFSGVGAPNRYSAPYSVSAEDPLAITVALLRSTLMAQIHYPERLREQEFYVYMQNAYRWDLVNNNLVLYSKNESGNDVAMVFSL